MALNLTVIVPARNEEDCLGACLESLVSQSDEGWILGRDWELLIVDDGSTDRTREIAQSFDGVIVISPAALPKGWTGKANAAWTAAQQARGEWLLFTDADTVHEPGDLRRALHEAEKHGVAMLSYSPRQIVTGFWERALMPLVFSELALAYPPAKVSDPESRLAAANGQFLLVQRDAYVQVGGHEAVAESMLEDVDLAYLVKRSPACAPIAQLDRAIDYESIGREFESLWAHHLESNTYFNLPTSRERLCQAKCQAAQQPCDSACSQSPQPYRLPDADIFALRSDCCARATS